MNSSTPKWVRSPEGILGGVCRGLAEQFGVDVWLVRLLWLFSMFFLGVGFLVYIAFWICLPRRDRLDTANEKMLLGVCARIGRRGDVETGVARLLAVFLIGTSLGAVVVGYILLYFLLPETPDRGTIGPVARP